MEYKNTLNLPKTDYPMRAELPKREPLMLAEWKSEGIYERILAKRKGRPTFILHDGPPFANGDAHMGHALNMTLKDIVLKAKNMSGFYVPFIPGWDCHGLPIEHKVMKESVKESLTPSQIRSRCAEYAQKYVVLQREQFERLGVFGDWQKPYLTMDPAYEADTLRSFAGMVEKGLVYQAMRPVHWSTGCQTALAEAEIEYQSRTDLSIFVKFPLTEASAAKLGCPSGTTLLIWTTTPWTLPANLAVAVSPRLSYGIYTTGTETVIAATALGEKIPNLAGAQLVGEPVAGTQVVGLEYQHPFLDRKGLVYGGDFVTAEAGTGLVHIAPGHGQDDYILGMQNGLPPFSPVDDNGKLTEEAGVPALTGLYVFKANPVVRDLLKEKGLLWAEQEYVHDYPHCWRSKTPIIFRAVKQWFIRVDAFRAQALEEIEKVTWVPAWGKSRIRGAVEGRPDWCISRQRTWGVPIPVFYTAEDEAILDGAVIRKMADLVEKEGTNVWFDRGADELASACGLKPGLRKGQDTLDVWIDSGTSHAAVLRRRLQFPADLYLEGSDQHRGWFQSSLLTSVALTGEAPYRAVLTNGFVVDVDGKKLSKSNTYQKPTDLMSFVNKYGADILRLWVAGQDYRDDVPFSEEIFTRVTDTYRTIRNTLRILLGNLSGFDAGKDAVTRCDWTEIDRYVDGQLQVLVKEVRRAYDAYEFHAVYHTLNRFCSVELSAFYVDVLKDRMYCDATASLKRRSAQTVMHRVAMALTKLLAPLAPFTAEETFRALGGIGSVHEQLFPNSEHDPVPAFGARWQKFLALRTIAHEKMEEARQQKKIGKSLEAQLTVKTPDFAEVDREMIEELCIVSRVILVSSPETSVEVEPASGVKCVRCWKLTDDVGSNASHPELCARCAGAVEAMVVVS